MSRIIFASATLAVLVATLPAHAVTSCAVKVDKKTGVIQVSAKGVEGPLSWGGAADQTFGSFFNASECVSGSRAKGCELADPSTLAAKTPPAGCTLYVDDGVAGCPAWISGCTPRVAGYEVVVGDSVESSSSAFTATVNCPAGKKALGGGGSVFSVDWYLGESRPFPNGNGWQVEYIRNPDAVGVVTAEAWAVCAGVE